MRIPPGYQLTPKISHLLQQIEACKEVIDSYPLPTEVETNIRRQSTLRSSLFSARIEGNNLTLADLPNIPSKDQQKVEVYNILKALEWIYQRGQRDLSSKDILRLHQTVVTGLVEKAELGRIRSQTSAIFNVAGIAIYLPPRPSQINPLLNKLLGYVNSNKERFIPIRASLAHFNFEKIHPFLDGNGRVGRLLFQAILEKGGYGMKGLVPIEEYLDSHRSRYYQALEDSERDATNFLEFMLEALAESATQAKELVLAKQQLTVDDYLLPRRAEIFNLIKDQQLLNFDSIRRRFMNVNPRTIRYDLKKLQEQGLIKKRGQTKGVYYELSKT